MITFSELAPGQIDGLWTRYTGGLQEYISRWPDDINWSMEDVKAAIKKDTARMVNLYDGPDQVAFLVYRLFDEEFDHSKYIHLWLGYIYPEYRGRIREFLPDVFKFLNKVSKKTGAKYIEMDTPRTGWQRVMSIHDMKPQRTVYRREVT